MSASTSTAAPLPASPAAHAAAPRRHALARQTQRRPVRRPDGRRRDAAGGPARHPAHGFSPLVVGIVCGMLYGISARHHAGGLGRGRELHRPPAAAHRRGLYGLNISIQQIVAVGLPGLAVSVAVVLGTLLIGTVVGQRLLGLDRDTAMLTSAGSAICGAPPCWPSSPPCARRPTRARGRRCHRGAVRHAVHVPVPGALPRRLAQPGHPGAGHLHRRHHP